TEASAGLVAPVALVDPAVDTGAVDVRVNAGRRARAGRPVRATPTVAGRVDQHADVVREAGAHQLLAERLGERELVDVVVPVDPLRLAHRHAVDGVGHLEVRLHQRRVVGGVGDEAVHVADVAGLDGDL